MSKDLWDFYSYDGASDEELLVVERDRRNAEVAAIHVYTPGRRRLSSGPFVVMGQRFFPDEDSGRDSADEEADLDLETILERQHYAFADEPDEETEPGR